MSVKVETFQSIASSQRIPTRFPEYVQPSLEKIQVLSREFQNLPTDSNSRKKCLQGIFSSVSYVSTCFGSNLEAALKQPRGLILADKVINAGLFRNYPGSESRLTPLAQNLVQSFINVVVSTQVEPEQACRKFSDSLEIFIANQKTFSNAYFAEMVFTSPNQPDVVRVTHKEDIAFFCRAYVDIFLEPSLNELVSAKEKLLNSDPELVMRFSELGLFKLLLDEVEDLPKFYQPYQSEIRVLQKRYMALKPVSQQSFFDAIQQGNQPADPVLKQLRTDLVNLSGRTQGDAGQAPLYAGLLSNVYNDLGKSFSLACQMKKILQCLPAGRKFSMQSYYDLIYLSALSLNEADDAVCAVFQKGWEKDFKARFHALSDTQKRQVCLATLGVEKDPSDPTVTLFIHELKREASRFSRSRDFQYGMMAFVIIQQ